MKRLGMIPGVLLPGRPSKVVGKLFKNDAIMFIQLHLTALPASPQYSGQNTGMKAPLWHNSTHASARSTSGDGGWEVAMSVSSVRALLTGWNDLAS
jgi:hypothetical protein